MLLKMPPNKDEDKKGRYYRGLGPLTRVDFKELQCLFYAELETTKKDKQCKTYATN